MSDVVSPSAGAVGPVATEAPQKLSDVMLAMDVVDTLRHQEGLVREELGQDNRDEALKVRLRQIYEAQGLEVSDHILEEGIRALKESRFVYTPPPPSFGRTMARFWVRRGQIGMMAAPFVLLIAGIAGWQGWKWESARIATEQARVEMTKVLPGKLSGASDAARKEAKAPAAKAAVERLSADGQAALTAGDAARTNAAITGLNDIRGRLLQQYVLQIVSRPGEHSGVFRIPDVNKGNKNYYVIVEALTSDGRALTVPIRNEENGKTENVSKWGVRVPETTYEAVRKDKLDDGIIEQSRFGEKKRGSLEPDYLMPVEGGTITRW